jgi:hypothetical protein
LKAESFAALNIAREAQRDQLQANAFSAAQDSLAEAPARTSEPC